MVSVCPLYAGGSDAREGFDPKAELEKANDLIDKGHLDDAIAVLVDLAQHDPEQMERVQDLILEIRGIKSQVNEVFAELNEAIINGDERTAEAKIREIKELDKDPNRNTLNNLILAAIVVSKAINDSIRDDFYERGNVQLRVENYIGAVDLYRQGFVSEEYLEFYDEYVILARDKAEITRYLDDPGRQKMIWDAYGNIAPEGDIVLESIDGSLDEWKSLAEELSAASSLLMETILSDSPAAWSSATAPFMDNMESVKANIAVGTELSQELNTVKERLYEVLEGIPEDFRYERIGQYFYGRGEKIGTEGILLAQRLHWESLFLNILEDMESRTEDALREGRTAYLAGDWTGADSSFRIALEAADSAVGFLASEKSLALQYGDAGDETFKKRLDEFEAYTAYAAAAVPVWRDLSEIGGTIPDIENLDYASIGIDNIDEYVFPLQDAVNRAERMKSDWDSSSGELSALPGAAYSAAESVDSTLRSDLDSALDEYNDKRLLFYVNTITPLYENMEASTRELMSADIDSARLRIEGADIPEDSEELPDRHPSEVLENIVLPSLASLGTAEKTIGDFLDILDSMLNRDPPIDDPERILEFSQRAENLIMEVAEHRDDLNGLQESANGFITAARRAEISASNALASARRNLTSAQSAAERGRLRNDIDEFYRAIDLYDAAEGSLDDVDAAYLEMLINDADIAAASGIDAARSGLRNDVRTDRSRLAVTVKQNAVEGAKKAYDEGGYSSGLTMLNQSQEFWERSYGENDPEMEAWIVRLQNAQQALQQTVIEETDPLFAEMNQYLNLANRYYVAGIRVVESNPRSADALKSFRSANDLVRQVLNTFPGNEAALLLEQKILKQTDEDTWTAEARSLVNQTRRAVGRNDVVALRGNSTQKGLYGQIKVLEKIDPEFSGLKQLIYDAEVVLGIIIPPPDPAVLAESRRITGEARRIWENLGAAGSDRAVELLDSALVLWLDNAEASNLKNEILLSVEPARLPAFPAELLHLLELVEDSYGQSNFILAKALLGRIDTEFSAFSNDPRIREWKRKVEARL